MTTVTSIMTTIASAAPWGYENNMQWALATGFVVAFILSFAVGANDVANSFGTTVGAKVLTLKKACILATIFETSGAVLMGARVGQTIRKGIIDPEVYNEPRFGENGTEILLLGQLSAMFGSTVWQLIATVFKLPVSGTHSIVGGIIGFSLVAAGVEGVNFIKLAKIVASWFISPILSGVMAVLLYVFVQKVILEKENPLRNGLICLPVFYGLTMAINALSILMNGAPMIGLEITGERSGLIMFGLTAGIFALTFMLVSCLVVPYIRKRAQKVISGDEEATEEKTADTKPSTYTTVSSQDSVNSVSSDSSLTSTKKGFKSTTDSGYQTPCYDRAQLAQVQPMSVSTAIEKMNMEMKETDMEDSLLSESAALTNDASNKELIKTCNDGDLNETSLTVCSNKALLHENETSCVEEEEDQDPAEVTYLFSSLQVLTACFASFAHGANDVSNAIGPMIALWIIYFQGDISSNEDYPWYLLCYGAVGICAGLWILGRRVIETIGSKLTNLTPSRGFCIEIMTAVTVLLASNVGIPVSTTHCKVGAVVSIGLHKSRKAVDWSLVKNIAAAWFITLPVSGILSAIAMKLLLLTI